MSEFYGDFRAGQTVRCRFNTTSSAGVPTTLTAGAVIVSRDGSDVTPSGGVTLTTDVGSVTGRHHVVVDTSVDTSTFTAGSDYAVRLSGSSAVGGTSVVGIVVGEWSIANRAVAVDSSGRVTLAATTHTGAVIPTVTTTGTTTTLTNLPAAPTDWITAVAVSAAAVTKVQAGLATPTNITAGTIATVSGNVAGSVGSVTAAVTLPANPPAGFLATASFAAGATVPRVTLVDTATNLTNAGTVSLGSTAPAGWINTAAFASGTTLPRVTLVDTTTDVTNGGTVTLGATAPAGWINTAAFASGALVPADVRKVVGGDPVPADLNNVGLRPTGLDQISMAPEVGVPTTWRGAMVWIFRRSYRSHKTPTALVVESDAGAALTTQVVSDDGSGTESIGPPA